MFSWWDKSITRLRPGTTVSRGSAIYDWSKADTLIISGCDLQPGATARDMDGRVLNYSDGYTAYLPAGADVQAGDRIIYNGNTYEINGDIRPWNSPTGAVAHIQLNLTRWTG